VRLAGRNGRGKSTIVELASGYLRPRAGHVTVFGTPAHLPDARQRRRVCRSSVALYPAMTVRDHLALAALVTGGSRTALLSRADEVGLGPWLDQTSAALSTGSARKAWFLMCTAGDFDLVLLDEPFNGLDAQAEAIVVSELVSWSSHRMVVVVSHALPPGLVFDRQISLDQEVLA
jgi:ABC-type multidrug transport system ATPase subunit